MSESQYKFMQLLLKILSQSLEDKDLPAMEKLLHQGASMASQMLQDKEGPLQSDHEEFH